MIATNYSLIASNHTRQNIFDPDRQTDLYERTHFTERSIMLNCSGISDPNHGACFTTIPGIATLSVILQTISRPNIHNLNPVVRQGSAKEDYTK